MTCFKLSTCAALSGEGDALEICTYECAFTKGSLGIQTARNKLAFLVIPGTILISVILLDIDFIVIVVLALSHQSGL